MIPQQVYQAVGEAVHMAQALNISIRALLSVLDKPYIARNGDKQIVIADDGETLGRLIDELKTRGGMCQNTVDAITAALEARDWLVNHFFVRDLVAFATRGASELALATLGLRTKEIALACALMDGFVRVSCEAIGIRPGDVVVRQDIAGSTRSEAMATLDDLCRELGQVSKVAQLCPKAGDKTANNAYASDLLQDCIKTFPHWFGPDEQFWRRTAVRAAFGAIEGWCSWVRADIRPMVEAIRAAGLLAPEEEQKADELFMATDRHETALDDKGLPKKQKRKTSFLPMFRATVRLYSLGRAVGSGFADKHFSKDGWSQLRLAVRVRDRVTHPHESNDIVVSQDDLYAVREGMNWYIELVKDIDAAHAQVMNALKERVEILKARENSNGEAQRGGALNPDNNDRRTNGCS